MWIYDNELTTNYKPVIKELDKCNFARHHWYVYGEESIASSLDLFDTKIQHYQSFIATVITKRH